MKTKKPQTYCEMLQEVYAKFSEYKQMGYAVEPYIFSLLHEEREKNFYLEQRVEYLERKCQL